MRNNDATIRAERETLQVHPAGDAEVSGRLHRTGSGSVLGDQIQRNGSEVEGEAEEATARREREAQR